MSLLDAAAYLREIPDDHPGIRTLSEAGCFQGGVFDPGPEGAVIIRDWQLADEQSAGPADLLTALAEAADRTRPGGPLLPEAAQFALSVGRLSAEHGQRFGQGNA